MNKSSASSAANAVCEHMHDWWYGTKEGSYVSMGVISDGNSYGVADDLVFSFPLTIKDGEWKIVNDLKVTEFSKQKFEKT
mmetsp:Transcript_15685/g.21282  ORF Transcript_15685/g.21282 Transcript_15685/m.21282 type:complete len:80 (+) Transcript_15685:779-1018(+)